MNRELLRNLPKVDELLKEEIVEKELGITIRSLVIDALRETVDYYRDLILKGEINGFSKEDVLKTFKQLIDSKKSSRLKKVINATGTVIHTNLGRSLLSQNAVEAVINISQNYNNLEYDVEKGKRGLRYSHIEDLITKITGAEAAMVVNNNASAVMLVLNTLCNGKEAIVSRGQLVEIGGSFRVPEVMKFSGATLVEVGTTNRTHLYDYENNINENTGVLLKVHTSNFKIMGFTEEVSLEELVHLGEKSSVPTYEDIGSGVLIDYTKYGLSYEPTVQESIKRGIDVVSFSGDKMLGGPQAGIIVGKKEYIDKMKKNQLTRALRVDKMTLAALEATLRLYLDENEAIDKIPTLNMLLSSKAIVKKKAESLKRKLRNKVNNFKFTLDSDYSMVGGGSMPTERIETYVIKVSSHVFTTEEIEYKLRMNKTPIVVRICNNEVIMDLRTIFSKEFDSIVEAFLNMK